ncbi:diguanylate cyclase domain-containing protein [Chloroflexota bacterium]
MSEIQPRLRLSLLGSFRCLVEGKDVSAEFRTKKERALLAYLAVESDRKHQRDALGELFWPGKPEGYARMNLRQALSGIRRAIQVEDGLEFLMISDEFIRFNSSNDTEVDCMLFDRVYDKTSSHQHQNIENCPDCVAALGDLISLYRGEFLEEFLLMNVQEFREWALFRRENYFRRLLTALHILIKYNQDKGQIKLALDYAYRQAKLAHLEERAHRQLMMLLALDGRRSAAMEQYQLCCRILADELDVSPDLETTALYEKIKAGLVLNRHHPITTPNNTNLPVQFTKFIGRENEMSWVVEAIKNPVNRLFSIIGISGIGKTRLAIQIGAKLINEFSDGVWFIPLNAIHHVDLIPQEIARVLKIDLGEADPRRVVIKALQSKNLLLIIDNFEHLLAGTPYLLEILNDAPGIKILITSQRRISYQAAHICELKGLPYPKRVDRQWRSYDAVRLFITRAKQNQPDVEIDEQCAPHLVQICDTVDGLPLGLELAAAGMRFYSCEHIAKEIQRNFDMLQTTLLDIPERHRSIRAAFNQSWSMLTEAEQDVFRRLSVFQGEFSIDEAIATTGAHFMVISNLVDHSLIQKNASGYYLIQPILRQYAAEKLEEIYDFDHSDLGFYGIEIANITRDSLTGLPNKILFRDLFKHSLAIARRRNQIVGLLLVEIGDLSTLEKKVGRDAFNTILRDTAKILLDSVRDSDIVAHLLPGKFAIILDGIAQFQDGALVTKKIQAKYDQSKMVGPEGTAIKLNIGISIYPQDSQDIVELLRFANIALNKAKTENQYFRYYSYEEPVLINVEM